VGVQVEAVAHAEQDVVSVLAARYARVADRAEQHGAARPLHLVAQLARKRGAVFEIKLRAERQLPHVDVDAARAHVVEHAQRLGDDFRPDAIAGNHGDARSQPPSAFSSSRRSSIATCSGSASSPSRSSSTASSTGTAATEHAVSSASDAVASIRASAAAPGKTKPHSAAYASTSGSPTTSRSASPSRKVASAY